MEEWPEKSLKRWMPDGDGRRGRRGKRIKIDEESLKRENPRQQGIQKRKSITVPNPEFERECKRLRPEFDHEREVNFICNQEENVATADENSKPKDFFQIFNPQKAKIKVQLPRKSNPKSKSTMKTANQIRKESLTHSAAQKNSQDIRTFLKMKAPNKLASEDQNQLQQFVNTNLGGSEVRDGESGVSNWDPGL